MIRSESEYQQALKRLEEDQHFADQQRSALVDAGLKPEEVERGMEPLLAFQAQLQEEVAWYERVSRGDFGTILRLTELGRLLIAVRIAQGLTQRQLADRLGVSEAQVSRDERNEYHGIGVDRAQRILDVLGVTITVGVQEQPDPTRRPVAAGIG
jgi:DNA-directed RNA polymerase specialized sigma subunit